MVCLPLALPPAYKRETQLHQLIKTLTDPSFIECSSNPISPGLGLIASTSKIFPSLCCSLPISRTFTACPKMSSGYQSPKTVQQATTGCPQARFDLPGLNLPLNWTPHKEYTKYSQPDRLAFPKQGDGMDLFPTALNDQSLTDGYCA